MTSRWRRALAGTAAGLVLLVAFVGALHTPWGRPLLAKVSAGIGGCPSAHASAREVNALRLRGLAAGLRGADPARARPALGFALDRSTPADVRAWAAAIHVACAPARRGLLSLHCRTVPREALPDGALAADEPTIEDLAFTFDPAERLISVDAFTRGLAAPDAATCFSSAKARLGATLGPPADRAGDLDAAALPLFATARVRYRFSDYVAIVSLVRLPGGLAVRQQYLSAT